MLNPGWFLTHSTRVRYANGALAYFGQGIPMGLLHISLPAWLVVQGVSARGVATFMAIITLPWAFKLITGPLMDHWEFLPMGKHRPWVLGAQLGMVLSLLALMVLDDPVGQLGLLTAICFMINAFTATQDVATDGMAIDFVPLDEEGRLNGFMSFGKAIGGAVTAAVTGTLLVVFGMKVTGLVCAVAATVILVILVMVREREGEKVLPWTAGAASPLDEPPLSFRQVFSDMNQVLWLRASLVIMSIMFIDGLISGYGRALMPVAAIQLFEFTTPKWAQLNAVMGLVGAVLALGLGPLIDRYGAKRMLFFTTFLLGLHAFLLAYSQGLWTNSDYVLAMMSAWIILGPVTMVCSLAIAMSICSHHATATQFAIYMSVANLGAAAGSYFYGRVAEHTNWSQNYALMGLLVFFMLLVILAFKTHDHPEDLLEEPSG